MTLDTNTLIWLACGGALAGILSVLIALVCGLHYSAALRRMPAAAFLEDVVARLDARREELARLDGRLGELRADRVRQQSETETLAARRDALSAQLKELQEDLAGLDGRRAEIAGTTEELSELRTRLAATLDTLETRRAESGQLEREAERARAVLALLDERKTEIEAIDAAEREARARLLDAQTALTAAGQARDAAQRDEQQALRALEALGPELERLRMERGQIEAGLPALRAARDALLQETENLHRQQDTLTGRSRELQDDIQRLQTLLPMLAAKLETLREETAAITDERNALKSECGPLAAEVDGHRQQLDSLRTRHETLDAELRRLHALQTLLEARIEYLQQEADARRSELQSLTDAREPLAAEVDQLQRRLDPLRVQHDALADDISRHQARLPTLQVQLESLQQAMAASRAEHETLTAERARLDTEARQARQGLEQLRMQLDSAETELNRRRAELAALAPARQPEDAQGDALADLEQPPACLVGASSPGAQPLLPKPQRDEGEAAALERVQAHLSALGLRFPERTLHAFHTALKTATISPLTVLAGISGTGKSQLPRRYAEAMGIHFLKLPVQPRWDSPQDMLGFYNYLEKRYKATEFARALVHFDAHNWPHARPYRDRLLLVLLDEMNLARVEYYFSEFLSQLEGRPAPKDHDPERIRNSEIVLDAGGAGGVPPRIYPGHNLLFVGTMNEDESTQTLSDKVLDRANLLRFPRPDRLVGEALSGDGRPASGYLPESRWHGWRRSFGQLPKAVQQPVERWIQHLNEDLDGLHRPFAHRVNQAMLAYVANYPGVAEPGAGDALACARLAFADQLEQRILPKLRGVDLGDAGVASHLERIGRLIEVDLDDPKLATAFRRAREDDGSGRPFLWTGVRRESA